MPNVEETYQLPWRPEQITSDNPDIRLEFERTRHAALKKMYESLAIGVNDTFEINLQQQGNFDDPNLGQPLNIFPPLGMFLIIVSGLEDDMPMIASLAMKQTVGTAATFSTVASKAGVGSTWNTLNVLVQSVGDQIGVSHDGTGNEQGLASVTVLGAYNPEDSG